MGKVTVPLDGGLGQPADAPLLGPLPGTLTAFRPSLQRCGQASVAPAALLSGLPAPDPRGRSTLRDRRQ